MNVNQRINNLRKLMTEKGITAYLIPTSDPHQSEYVADYYKGRIWISGFTGSAGTVIITQDEAILWTDGRYFIQAENELKGSEYKLYKMATPGFPTYVEYLSEKLKVGDTLGFDGRLVNQADVEKIENSIEENIKFVDQYDLVGDIWNTRPEAPVGDTFIHESKYTGLTTSEKIQQVRDEMKKKNADYFLLSSLDDIAWLYNIRGKDVPNNPVVISYALVTLVSAFLFVDSRKMNMEVESFLKDNGVLIASYEEIGEYVKNFGENSRVLLDKSRVNRWIFSSIPSTCKIIDEMNITTVLKGIKNPTEIESQKNAYLKDGVALTKFIYWLDKNIGKIEITELSAEEKLLKFRQEQELFLEPSFNTIAAYKENAAMMHYSASPTSFSILEAEGLFLVDSGGQYLDGTTDITRTMILGPITEEEKKDYTLTLKGHINLINARFLAGTNGHALDILCRYPLWQEGIDYKCGTGHGIGFLLNVHEGPHRFANVPNDIALKEGMIVTIEPGVYKAGKHGIRIENVVVVQKDIATDSGQFMKFDTLSFVPIDLEGVNSEILSENEKTWLNNYHSDVYAKLSPYLNEEEKLWLEKETRAI